MKSNNVLKCVIRASSAIFLTGMLLACSINLKLDYKPTDLPPGFELIDSRPQAEIAPTENWKTGFPGYIMGDASFNIDRRTILKERLQQELGAAISGKRIELLSLQSIEFHPHPTNLDLLVFPKLQTSIPELLAIDIRTNVYWAVCILSIKIDGVVYKGFSSLGYRGATVDYGGNHTKVLLSAIDQVVGKYRSRHK